MRKVIVASRNPIKMQAVSLAFDKVFPDEQFEVVGISVDSGVADQPLSDQETFQGALNRANKAREQNPEADFWVGLEGGLERRGSEMHSFAWMVTLGENNMGKGRTGVFLLPKKIVKLIDQGKELGEADDEVFGKRDSKKSNGAVGILTHDLVTRATYYEQAMIFSLIPFKNPDLF